MNNRIFPTVILFLLALFTLFVCAVVYVEEVGAQGEYPLADGQCGPTPSGTVTTLRPFVARTAPFTQAPGSGGEIPRGTNFPVGTIVCDEGVTFVAVFWDGQTRWLPNFWIVGGIVWGAILPPTPTPVVIQQGLVGFATPPVDQNWLQILVPSLRIRSCGDLSCAVVERAQRGAYFIVLSAEPVSADGYTWINVSWGNGTEGWVASEFTTYAVG